MFRVQGLGSSYQGSGLRVYKESGFRAQGLQLFRVLPSETQKVNGVTVYMGRVNPKARRTHILRLLGPKTIYYIRLLR